ncbi:MAG TPA: VCBS repeat-containing protein, partial [Planctomycetota bacterium]|nr:VCBS repeat-containing protein [Planctomycetota bacterium]
MLRNGFLAFATTVACAGFSSAQTLPWPDVAAASNVTTPTSFSHVLARGAACADFNGDGMVDLVVPDEPGSSFDVYLNLGGWFFIDISPVAGFGPTVQAKGFAPADYDNDGDQDLFICVKGGPCRLLQNNGMMMFVDVANAAGVDFVDDAFHATWGDYDGDGRLDLYVGVRRIPGAPASNRLFRNVGDGTFEDVTVAAGVAHDSLT